MKIKKKAGSKTAKKTAKKASTKKDKSKSANDISAIGEVQSPALINATKGSFISIVKTVDPFNFIASLVGDILVDHNVVDTSENSIQMSSDPGKTNYLKYVNFISRSHMNSADLTACIFRKTGGSDYRNPGFNGAMSQVISAMFGEKGDGIRDDHFRPLIDFSQAGQDYPRLANSPGNIINHILSRNFLNPAQQEAMMKKIESYAGALAQTLEISQDGSGDIKGNEDFLKVYYKALNSRTIVNFYFGFIPEILVPLKINYDEWKLRDLMITESHSWLENEHNIRIGTQKEVPHLKQAEDLIPIPLRVYNIFFDTENTELTGSLPPRVPVINYSPSRDQIMDMMQFLDIEKLAPRVAKAVPGKIQPGLEGAFSFFTQRFRAGKEEKEVMKDYHRSISETSRALVHVNNSVGVNDLGGLDLFKKRVEIYSKYAEDTGDEGHGSAILLTGVQGAGKSMAAHWAAAYLKGDLYRFNISNVFDAFVGNSEANISRELNIVRSLGNVVLHVDEVEKVFGGAVSSHASDGGILLRVMEKFMAFLEEENPGVFIVMTANSTTGLPAELLRSGRVSAIMFVDYPTDTELAGIVKIQNRLILGDQLEITDIQAQELAHMFSSRCYYSGIDVREIFRTVSDNCLLEDRSPVIGDVLDSFILVQPNYEKHREKIDNTRSIGLRSFELASSDSEDYVKYKEDIVASLGKAMAKMKDSGLKDDLQERVDRLNESNNASLIPSELQGM